MVKAKINLLKYNPSGKMVKSNANLLKYLVLYLYNTLIFCKHIYTKKCVRHKIILRPHLFEFLNTLRKYCILYIFQGKKTQK